MISLKAKIREERKKGPLKRLRKEGYLPAVVYGKEIGSLPLKVDYKEFLSVYKKAGKSTILSLEIENSKEKKKLPVLIREVQKHPLTEKFLHVDFYQLPMKEEVELTVPLIFEGEAPAEKELGGVLVKNLHEVPIKARAENLISSIKVDVSSLETFDDEIKIKDLKVPEGIKILAPEDETVAVVVRPEEETKEEEIIEEEKIEEKVEVISEKGKEEEKEEE